jgi:hypothetical protein
MTTTTTDAAAPCVRGCYALDRVYGGDYVESQIRILADGQELHGLTGEKLEPVEEDVQPDLTTDGTLTLEWRQAQPTGGNRRGNQVAEVWLLRR